MELEIILDAGSGKPLYEQIYRDIRDRIRSGELAAGERLPATRIMAQNLHVARSTAELAYEQLEAEGYIEKRRGSGAYVCDIEHIAEIGGISAAAADGYSAGSDAANYPLAGGPGGFSEPGALAAGRSAAERNHISAGPAEASSRPDCVHPSDSAGMHSDRQSAYSGRKGAYPDKQGAYSGRKGAYPDDAVKERTAAAPDTCGDSVIDFSPRTIDMSAFPYATWRRIMRGILTGDRADLFTRGEPQGDLSLRATIARYLHLARGCHCTPEQIVIGAGNDYLMMLLTMVLGEGRRIGMESPTYLRAAGIAAAMHDEVVPIRSDASGMDVRSLSEADCSLAYCMPTRQYPTGVSMPWPRRSQLLQWAAAAPDRFIIEDDYDSEFKYRGRPVPSLQSQDTAGRVIYIGTFSKSIAPAVRVSYLILPPALMDVFRARAGILSCTVARMDQAILDEFIRDGYFERHLNRMRSRYRARHDLMLEVFPPLTQSGAALEPFEITGAGAGLHLVLKMREAEAPHSGESMRARNIRIETELTQRAEEAGVRVYPMSEAFLDAPLPAGQTTPPAILLGYASLNEDEIRRGAELLAGAWGK